MKTMSKKQLRTASTLIREECCNHISGECVALGCPCPQLHSYSLICKWFAEAAPPLDKQLYADIMGADGLKPCAVCNRPFQAVSNRAKYCSECAGKQRKKHKAARMREYRAG